MYKAPLTATVFKDFSACYQHFSPHKLKSPDQPFVYVDGSGVKLVTNVVEGPGESGEGIFALSMAQDGWVEMLAFYEAG